MTSSILDQLVNRSRQLYTLPAVAMQVVELTSQPTIDATALKECIENDPALSTKILRVVNSSLFGLSRQVTDLNQAVALMGTKPLKLLVLGFSLPKELLTGLEADVLQRYWRRTVIKAVAARELAETLWRIPGDDAFIAGLLQDLGVLVLIQDLGETYLAFLERIYQGGGDLLALETGTLGFDHAVLSARLLEHWGLPASIVRDVGRPFNVEMLDGLSEQELVVPRILHMADLVAEFLTRERTSLLNELMDVGGRYKGVSIDELEALIASLERKVPQLADVLSLKLPNETAYSTILSRAYAQLCDAAESASLDLLGGPHLETDAEDCEFGDLLQRAQALQGEIGDVAESRIGRHAPNQLVRKDAGVAASDHNSDGKYFAPARTLRQVSAPSLLGSVEAAVKACRQARRAVSLALLELDHSESVAMRIDPAQVHRTMDRLQSMMHAIVVDDGKLMQVDDYRFAVVFEGCDRQPAVELTRQLVRCARQWSVGQAETHGHTLSLSAGVATLTMPPKNFPCQELIDAAERCLHGVQLSGGDSVKSIDIY
ncbi:MAG: HDOD domain-containing protein [Planctomycetota bacterium]|nr:HDOD domain-containing protein [Planctomycetota bacterium]